jgi:flagellar basal-body rod protein FlgF
MRVINNQASTTMDNGIYIMLSRQLALFRDMEITANNIANTNTTGYNSEHLLFNSYLTKDVNQRVVNPMSFAYDINSYRNTETGSMTSTGNPLDVAIQGDGYFMVETPLGTRYTRAGNFQIDASGILTTVEGYAVLDQSEQRITLPDDAREIEIGESGNVKVNGEEFGSIGVVRFENEQLLERLDGRLYKSEVTPQEAIGSRVLQGALESSNVKPVIEMTHMIDVSRSVGSTARFIEVVYELQRKAASAWAQQG